DGDRRPEGDQHAAAECLASLEREAYRDERQRGLWSVLLRGAQRELVGTRRIGTRAALVLVERDAGGAGFDPLDPLLGVGSALGIHRDHLPGPKCLVAGREHLGVPVSRAGLTGSVCPTGVVLVPVDGDDTGSGQEASKEGAAEDGGAGEVVDRTGEHHAYQ